MKIKSNFKDYYDHIAFRYGGGDPKIVYIRPYIKQSIGKSIDHYDPLVENNRSFHYVMTLQNHYYHWRAEEPVEAEVMGLVIGDIFFTYIKRLWEPVDKAFRIITEKEVSDMNKSRIVWRYDKYKYDELVNGKDTGLVNICRSLKTPVFMFTTSQYPRINRFFIDPLCPKLGEMGVAKYIKDTDMYQYLSYFVGNTMNISPDMMPEIKVSDKDKIIGHGFDYKTSFRGK